MSDMMTQRDLARRLEQTQVTERPGGVTGLDVFYVPLTSYTPTYLGGTTAGATTYTLQQGSYVRIGSVVIVTGTVAWSASTGTGNAQVSLPIAASAIANQNYAGACVFAGVTFANGPPSALITPSNAFFTLNSPITNGASATVQMEAAGTIIFSLHYFI